MKSFIREYLNKLLSYIPVAIFVYTLLIVFQLPQIIIDLKEEFGIQAINEFGELYMRYFYRTIILASLIPFFDFVFTLKKVTYRNAIILHCLFVTITVGLLVFESGMPLLSLVISIAMSIVIYTVIWIVIYLREKQFINDANEIFKQNQ